VFRVEKWNALSNKNVFFEPRFHDNYQGEQTFRMGLKWFISSSSYFNENQGSVALTYIVALDFNTAQTGTSLTPLFAQTIAQHTFNR